jgi:hypothetical protein
MSSRLCSRKGVPGKRPKISVPFVESPLDTDYALSPLKGVTKFNEKPIPGRLDLSSMVRSEHRANEFFLFVAQSQRALFVDSRGRRLGWTYPDQTPIMRSVHDWVD